ncbi:MAG TPA: lasso peptide biosynthesis B2 protein, partial [bacterium]|nr:lasso peptide biosynthesis B2 protein [bacterium]
AFLLLLTVRFALFIIPFKTFRHLFDRICPVPQQPPLHDEAMLDKKSWLIRVAGRYVPGSEKCLSEALVTQALLRQEGFPALLKIGVTKSEEGKLHAHAWVESCEKIVIGGKGVTGYKPLVAFAK